MRLTDLNEGKLIKLLEFSSGGSTSAGSIASLPGGMGTISRTPNLFGYIPEPPKKKKKKRK
jgi:hypothetical protein